MTDDDSATEPDDPTNLSRRTTLGVLGASALGIGATGTGSADDEGLTITGAGGPAPFQVGNAAGEDVPLEDGDPVFDLEPEYPPYVKFEEMKEEYNGFAVLKYLRKHGTESLLGSHRAVVDPEGNPQTWGEFSDEFHPDDATVEIEPAARSDSHGHGGGHDRSSVKISFDGGLYPNAVYSVWVVHRVGWHRPLGGNKGKHNGFATDAAGEIKDEYTDEGDYFVVMDEPDELTLPPGETVDEGHDEYDHLVSDDEAEGDDIDPIPITEYPLHELETSMPPVRADGSFALVVAYHYDNRIWYQQPGPYFLSHVVLA